MKKINSMTSTVLSIFFCAGLLSILFASLFFIPQIVKFMTLTHILAYGSLKLFFTIPISLSVGTIELVSNIIVYTLSFLGLLTSVFLLLLLLNVKKDIIFTSKNVSFLRACSWLCIIAAILFFVLGSVFWTCLLLSFAAALVGIMLRVVKNIIERAVELKEENDLTI